MTARRRTDGAPMVTDGATTTTKPKRRYTRHGYHALRAKVAARGLAALDTRTANARALLAWRGDLYAALGGEDAVTPPGAHAHRGHRAAATLRGPPGRSTHEPTRWHRRTTPQGSSAAPPRAPRATGQRALPDSISRMLAQLGIQRRAKPVKSLEDILAGYAERDEAQQERGDGQRQHEPGVEAQQ